MTHLVRISPVTQADIPAMAEVVVQCEAQDPLTSMWYGSCIPEIKKQLPGVVLSTNLEDPSIRMFKATLTQNDKVVGYGSLCYSQGDVQYPVIQRGSFYKGMNEELYATIKNEMAKKRKHFLDGEKHTLITIKVLPQHDGDDVDCAMLHWAFNHLGLEMETIWALERRIESRAYFEFGWKTVDVINIDLAKWAKEDPGGVYQMKCMLRRPGKLESTGNIAENDERQ